MIPTVHRSIKQAISVACDTAEANAGVTVYVISGPRRPNKRGSRLFQVTDSTPGVNERFWGPITRNKVAAYRQAHRIESR